MNGNEQCFVHVCAKGNCASDNNFFYIFYEFVCVGSVCGVCVSEPMMMTIVLIVR